MQTAIRIILIALVAGLIVAGAAAIKHQRALSNIDYTSTSTDPSEF